VDQEPEVRDVEARLHQLGATLRSELGTSDVVPAVAARLRRDRVAAVSRSRGRIGRLAALVAVGLVVTTSAAWAVKAVFFDGGAVTVHRGPAPTKPLVAGIDLGKPVSLEHAQTLPTFVEPHVPWLTEPPTAWVDDHVPGQMSLSYPPGRGLPEVSASGLGMVIQTFDGDGREVIRKYLANDTQAQRVQIAGVDAVFLSGGDHTLFYLRPDGTYATAAGRLVGDALILRQGRLTVRIEANLSLQQLVELANSLSRHAGN
jgi:hypothetical protein